MLVGGRAVRLASIALFVAVPLSGQEPPPDPEADPEILVIARKLRKVRLNYTTRGSWVPKCEAEVSSGEPRIDRIMCAILRACVREGHREVAPAKACMAKRIDQLADGAAPPTDVAAAPPPPVPQPPQTGPDIVVEGAPDIVVTGNVASLRGGLWLFRRTATLALHGGNAIRPFRFTQCLPDGTVEVTLRRWAGEENLMSGLVRGMQCGRLRAKMGNGRIDASRSCNSLVADQIVNLTGRYDTRQLVLNYLVEQRANGIERGGGAGWNPPRPPAWRWQVTATRQGDCPLRERRDELNVNEVMAAMFEPRGIKEPGSGVVR